MSTRYGSKLRAKGASPLASLISGVQFPPTHGAPKVQEMAVGEITCTSHSVFAMVTVNRLSPSGRSVPAILTSRSAIYISTTSEVG